MQITGDETWKCKICSSTNSCEYSYCKNKCIRNITKEEKKEIIEQTLLIDKLKTEIANMLRIPKSRLFNKYLKRILYGIMGFSTKPYKY